VGFSVLDWIVFFAFIAAVLAVGLLKSRRSSDEGEQTSQDYFLAGRGLSWWLVGFSLIAANISSEQFVGMSGSGASHVGLAIASYEWLAAITLVVVAFGFLPYFLRIGIYTMPEFLEYRYNGLARFLMASATVLIYVLLVAAVTYSGALTVQTLASRFGVEVALWMPSLFIALIAMIYVVAGGLKASVWADLLQGSALIVGGLFIMWLAFGRLGEVETAAKYISTTTGEIAVVQLDPEMSSVERFVDLNRKQLNMFLPATDNVLPWTALLLGVWIPNFYYWGLNQYITQRTLGSSSLAQGQKGIVFAAYLKLLIPFIVVIPGILAFNLFSDEMRLEARGDASGALALYIKANPETAFVTTMEAPDTAAIEAAQGPGYIIALYESKDEIAKEKAKSPWVLPMTKKAFENKKADEFQAFSFVEDHAWQHVNSDFAEEVDAHNTEVAAAAKAAGKQTVRQAMVAYKYDTALGLLLAMLPRNGLFGFVMAALLGAVISSLAAMLNAASSIFTLDLFAKHISPGASQGTLVKVGRVTVLALTVVAVWLSPKLSDPNISNSIFTIIQGVQGLISPGVLAIFAFGLLVRRAPRICGAAGLITNAIIYGSLWYLSSKTDVFADYPFMNNFLNWMAISFVACILVLSALTAMAPLKEPITFEAKTDLDLKSSNGAWIAGLIAIVLTIVFYIVFSPLVIAR
jgi:SSS family solute:Na+ symporter